MAKKVQLLPLSERPIPPHPAWLHESSFLLEAGIRSLKTEKTYRSGLRLFADWLQLYNKNGYSLEQPWPLDPAALDTAVILNFRNWLMANRSRATVTTYISAILGYLNYLDGQGALPTAVQLGKLQRQLKRSRSDRGHAETVADLDLARQAVPKIVQYYMTLPLPPENDAYNRRLSLLRDRALVQVLYATAARISEVVQLDRRSVDNGNAQYATIIGKGNKPRTLFLREYAQKAIRDYVNERADANPALFISHSRNARNARITATAVHQIIKKAVKALNLHPSLSAHDFRHYRATQLLREGMPLEVVQEFLGHTDIATTRNIYAPVLGVQVVSEWLDNVDIPPSLLTNN